MYLDIHFLHVLIHIAMKMSHLVGLFQLDHEVIHVVGKTSLRKINEHQQEKNHTS